MFLKISQILQENICVGVLQVCNFIKKRLRYRCFPVKIGKFLRTTFFTKDIWRPLLYLERRKNAYCFFRLIGQVCLSGLVVT